MLNTQHPIQQVPAAEDDNACREKMETHTFFLSQAGLRVSKKRAQKPSVWRLVRKAILNACVRAKLLQKTTVKKFPEITSCKLRSLGLRKLGILTWA